jgi:hypothetical protein
MIHHPRELAMDFLEPKGLVPVEHASEGLAKILHWSSLEQSVSEM